jgi:hypothetical protein
VELRNANVPNGSQGPGGMADLLSQASSILGREAIRVPGVPLGIPVQSPQGGTSGLPDVGTEVGSFAGPMCPVTGAAVPLGQPDKDGLRRQAHELLGGLFGIFGQPAGVGGSGLPMPSYPPGGTAPAVGHLQNLAGRVCPITGAAAPFGPIDKDQLRRQAHEFIETLLITFGEATGEKGLPTEDKVPLIQCAAPVQAGSSARATFRVANDENTQSDVALYCTNFVADSGYEIPSLRVNVTPRRATIPAKGEVPFEITIAVSQQTPTGIYSGLIQAMGSKYVKAVLSVQVN